MIATVRLLGFLGALALGLSVVVVMTANN
jgi:hypothetical protein